MPFGLLIAGIIFSVIAALVTLILSIIHLATGKQRSALMLGVAFLMSVIMMILSIMEVIERGSGKVKQGVEWVKEQEKKNKEKWKNDGYGEYYYAHIPDSVYSDSIFIDFAMNEIEEGFAIPLVYPYRFISEDDGLLNASLSGKPIDNDSCLNQMQFISHFTFDNLFLLAKRDNKQMSREKGGKYDLPNYSYLLFDFSTGTCDFFDREKHLFDEAEKRGFKGEKHFSSMYDHYWKYAD